MTWVRYSCYIYTEKTSFSQLPGHLLGEHRDGTYSESHERETWVYRQRKQHSWTLLSLSSAEMWPGFPWFKPWCYIQEFWKLSSHQGHHGGNVGLWSMVTPDVFIQMCLTISSCIRGQWQQQINYTPSPWKVDRKKCLYLALRSCSWLLTSCGTSWKIPFKSVCVCVHVEDHRFYWTAGGPDWKEDTTCNTTYCFSSWEHVQSIKSILSAALKMQKSGCMQTKSGSST